MSFQFEEVGIRIDTLPYGSFSGEFEVDQWGRIETIEIDTDPHCQTPARGSLRAWWSTEMEKPAADRKPPNFKHLLFDALAKELERRFSEKIEAYLYNADVARDEREADRRYQMQLVGLA